MAYRRDRKLTVLGFNQNKKKNIYRGITPIDYCQLLLHPAIKTISIKYTDQ